MPISLPNNLLEMIIETTYTEVDLHRRLRILRTYLENIYFSENHSGKRLEKFLKEHEGNKSDSPIINNWIELLKETVTESNFYQLIEELLASSEKIQAVTIYLPFIPEEDAKSKLCIWLRVEMQKPIFIDVKLDPTLLGGCALVLEGKYGNFSLRKRITDSESLIYNSIHQKMVD